jgi:calmodulin
LFKFLFLLYFKNHYTEGNGFVDYDEFIQMMTKTQLKPLSAEEELKKTFNIFDIDQNGFIDSYEIKKTMEHLGEKLTDEEVNDMIKAADKNGKN